MSKKLLIKQLDNYLNTEKKYKQAVSKLKAELKETGINLKHICNKIEVPYITILHQFKTGKMPSENFKKLIHFLE